MVRTTKAQRKALLNLSRRPTGDDHKPAWPDYRTARKSLHPGPGCVMIQWCNMWMGIEPDGYTHA